MEYLLVQVYLQENLIQEHFHLHDQAELKILGKKWYRVFLASQPIGNLPTGSLLNFFNVVSICSVVSELPHRQTNKQPERLIYVIAVVYEIGIGGISYLIANLFWGNFT